MRAHIQHTIILRHTDKIRTYDNFRINKYRKSRRIQFFLVQQFRHNIRKAIPLLRRLRIR